MYRKYDILSSNKGGFFMHTFSISKKKYEQLKEYKLANQILNTEGKIYVFTEKRKEKILKVLYNMHGASFANKLYTIEMLDTWRECFPTCLNIPDGFVSYRNNIIGFVMNKSIGVNFEEFLQDKKKNVSDKIFYFQKIGEILENIKEMRNHTIVKDFYLNDLHPGNFIVNEEDKSLNVVDLDSCKIGANRPFPAKFLTDLSLCSYVPQKYETNDYEYFNVEGDFIASEETDLYCYIISILNYLYGGNVHRLSLEEFYEYLNYLEQIGISKDLIQLFSKIVIPCKNENPFNLLAALKEEQIYRANSLIYERVKKR